MSMKTITLAGSEVRTEFSGAHAWLRNDGVDTVYAAAKASVAAGADGVVSILAGQSAPVYGANGTVYLLGTGSVQLIGSDYGTNPFKTSAQGGSGADKVARAAIKAHQENEDIHLTAEDVAGMVSGKNLLINPDLRIDQRGEAIYTATSNSWVRTVDGWVLNTSAEGVEATYNAATKTLSLLNDGYAILRQSLENSAALSGRTLTLSVELASVPAIEWNIQLWAKTADGGTSNLGMSKSTDNSAALTVDIPDLADDDVLQMIIAIAAVGAISLQSAQFELGSVATPFVPPDPATELLKCQRYFYRYGGLSYTTTLPAVVAPTNPTFANGYLTLPAPMRVTPSLTPSDGIAVIDNTGAEHALDRDVKFVECSADHRAFYINVRTADTLPSETASISIPAGGYLDFSAEL